MPHLSKADLVKALSPLPDDLPLTIKIVGSQCCVCGELHSEYRIDPYVAEIHSQTIWRFLCDSCYQEKLNDI